MEIMRTRQRGEKVGNRRTNKNRETMGTGEQGEQGNNGNKVIKGEKGNRQTKGTGELENRGTRE